MGFLSILIIILLTQSLLMTYGFEGFYESRKIANIQQKMDEIEQIYRESADMVNLREELVDYALVIGGSIVVFYEDTGSGISVGQRFLEPDNFWSGLQTTDEEYYIDRVVMDPTTGVEWMVCAKDMGEDTWLVVEIPVTSMDEAVQTLRIAFLYVMVILVAILPALSLVIARKIAQPITKLSKIAAEMQNLNFNARYTGDEKDEIGQLGTTLNLMSERLSATIELLKQELAKEKQVMDLRRQFTAQVSHELKTPLAIIKGYVEALTDDIPDTKEERDYYLSVIVEETDKINALIMQLLELTKLQTGNYPVEKVNLEYASLIRDILEKYQKIFAEKGFDLHFYNGADGALVEGDPLRLEQVFTNLINNALEHAHGGSIIRVSLRIEGNQLTTLVYNEGKQIPEEDIPHVFESFYKEKGSGGMGLGLAIVQGLLELHDSRPEIFNMEQGVAVRFGLTVVGHLEDEPDYDDLDEDLYVARDAENEL